MRNIHSVTMFTLCLDLNATEQQMSARFTGMLRYIGCNHLTLLAV